VKISGEDFFTHTVDLWILDSITDNGPELANDPECIVVWVDLL